MTRTLTEQKVLNKLKIDDFRHLTKDNVISMATMLDKMDPEVAKKALEQFPEFSTTTKEMLSNYKETLDKGLIENKESVQNYYDSCNSIIDSLKLELDKDDLSFEERKYIIDKMLEVSKMIGDKDSENKKFIATLVGISGLVVVGAVATIAATLGGNTNIKLDKLK